MKIKVSKILCKELSKRKDNSIIDSINVVKMDDRQYEWYVDYDSYKHENDYNFETGEFSVIQVVYNYGCYAQEKYVTTNDLLKIFKYCENKTIDSFCQEFNEFVAI